MEVVEGTTLFSPGSDIRKHNTTRLRMALERRGQSHRDLLNHGIEHPWFFPWTADGPLRTQGRLPNTCPHELWSVKKRADLRRFRDTPPQASYLEKRGTGTSGGVGTPEVFFGSNTPDRLSHWSLLRHMNPGGKLPGVGHSSFSERQTRHAMRRRKVLGVGDQYLPFFLPTPANGEIVAGRADRT